MRAPTIAVMIVAAACTGHPGAGSSSTGGTLGGGGGSTGTSGTPFVEAAHAPPPMLISGGGPIMANPTIAPLVWQSDSNAAQVQQFLQALVASPAYLDTLKPYGLQSLSYSGAMPSTATVPASLTDADLRTALKAAIAANPSVSAATLASTIFTFIIPQGTPATLSSGTSTDILCEQLGGYHSYLLQNGTPVVYAVVEECELMAPYPTNVLDATTLFLSHEISEAITDPQAFDVDPNDGATSNPAYLAPSDLSWFVVLGQGEVADLCAFPFAYFRDGAGFLEQHIWSNVAAQTGQDPCGTPIYFGVAPSPGVLQALTVTGTPTGYSATGLSIPVGETKMIPLTFFSSEPHAPWTVGVADAAALTGGSGDLTLGLSAGSGVNGDQTQLAIKVNRAGSLDGISGIEGVVVASKPQGADGGGSLWTILIQSP